MSLKVSATPSGLPLVSPPGGGRIMRYAGGVETDLGEPATPFLDVSAPYGPVEYVAAGVRQRIHVRPGSGGIYLGNGERLDVFTVDNKDPVEYETGGHSHRLTSGGTTVIYPLAPPAPTITMRLLLDRTRVDPARRITQSGVVWVRQEGSFDVIPDVRLVAVKDVHRTREFDCLEVHVEGDVIWDSTQGGPLPVGMVTALAGATYADARRVGFTFGSGSYLNLVDLVQKRGA